MTNANRKRAYGKAAKLATQSGELLAFLQANGEAELGRMACEITTLCDQLLNLLQDRVEE